MNDWYKKLVIASIAILFPGAVLFASSNESTSDVDKNLCNSEKARQSVSKCVDNKKGSNAAKVALQNLEKMSLQCPAKEKYLYFRGQCYEGLGRNQEALKDYIDANKNIPDDISIKHALARIHYKVGKYELAIKYATGVIQLDKTGFDGLILRAKIYEENESFKLALEDYREALKRIHVINSCSRGDKSCYSLAEEEIYLDMSLLHMVLDDSDNAINILKEGLMWNPGSKKLLLTLSKLYKKITGEEMKHQDYCP